MQMLVRRVTSGRDGSSDPLVRYHGRPLISAGTANRYLGRVVVELVEQVGRDGAPVQDVVLSVDRADGASLSHDDVLRLISTLLPAGVARSESWSSWFAANPGT